MKNLPVFSVGTASFLSSNASLAQSGNMMDGGMWGGSWMAGGYWLLIVLCIAVIGLVSWIITKK